VIGHEHSEDGGLAELRRLAVMQSHLPQ